jgi:molybdopterin-guanine dinucleotide biosynthesis protein A
MSGSLCLSGFVLAGGQSTRMGLDKARLEIAGVPLLLRTVNLLKPYVDSVAILAPAGRYEFIHEPTIPDRWPGKGPLAAILTGLEHLTGEWGIFLACDLPLLDGRFIELLIERAEASDSDAVVPRTAGGWQPLCAAYRRSSAHHIRQMIEEGETAIIKVLPRLQVDVITPEDLAAAGIEETIFENLNCPEDRERVLTLASARAQ